MPDSIKLLSTPRFRPFFLTQLAGAFNDNLYKNGLTIFIAFQAASVSQEESNTLVNIAAGLFILPFFLFSPIAGQLADKHEKSMLIRRIKLLEIAIMLLGAAAFMLQSPAMLVAILFLMGTQSALFGPVKYSLLPQALRPAELVGGNAMVEFGTFIAILSASTSSVSATTRLQSPWSRPPVWATGRVAAYPRSAPVIPNLGLVSISRGKC
jgi:MFS family permease